MINRRETGFNPVEKSFFLRSALLMCSLSSDQGTGRERFLSSPSRFGGLPRQVSLPHWSQCSLGCPEQAKYWTYPLHCEAPTNTRVEIPVRHSRRWLRNWEGQ